MSVFISYSHSDRAFVDRLASTLVARKINVWLDRWEILVGDSLIQKVEAGLEECAALLVVLSKTSVESEWCRKELSAGLIRELDERKVVVLPVLIEDCKIPLFLRDKFYADFRTGFDSPFEDVVNALAGVTSMEMGRVAAADSYFDWSEAWGEVDGSAFLDFALVQTAASWGHSILWSIRIVASELATRRYQQYVEADLEWVGRFLMLEHVIDHVNKGEMRLGLDSGIPKERRLKVHDTKLNIGFDLIISARRLGHDSGKDIIVDCGALFTEVYNQVKGAMRKTTHEETNRLLAIISTKPGS
jgi:hypothetical protein